MAAEHVCEDGCTHEEEHVCEDGCIHANQLQEQIYQFAEYIKSLPEDKRAQFMAALEAQRINEQQPNDALKTKSDNTTLPNSRDALKAKLREMRNGRLSQAGKNTLEKKKEAKQNEKKNEANQKKVEQLTTTTQQS